MMEAVEAEEQQARKAAEEDQERKETVVKEEDSKCGGRGEGEVGQSAVMAVIVQRSLERNLSMKDVCLERKQFSCWNGKTYKDLLPLLKTPQAKFAIWLQDHAHLVDLTAMQYANHYHANYVQPYWSKNAKPLYTIGNHIFYRL